jgi:hypothetical protein
MLNKGHELQIIFVLQPGPNQMGTVRSRPKRSPEDTESDVDEQQIMATFRPRNDRLKAQKRSVSKRKTKTQAGARK